MEKKKTSRQLQAEATKKKILNVVINLLEKKPLNEITVQEICAESDVSVGAYYHHFKGKEDVLREGVIVQIYDECDHYFEEHVIPAFKNRTDREAIVEYLVEQIRYASRLNLKMVQNGYKSQIDYGNRFFLSESRTLPVGLFDLVKRCQDAGTISTSQDPEDIARDLLVIARGIIYNWCVSTGTLDMECLIRSVAHNYLNGCCM